MTLPKLKQTIARGFSLLALLTTAGLLGAAALAPAAGAEVRWSVDPLASTTAPQGGTITYRVQVRNVGDQPADPSAVPISFGAVLPSGLTVSSVEPFLFPGGWDCSSVQDGDPSFACSKSGVVEPLGFAKVFVVMLHVAADAEGTLTTPFTVSGGDPANPTTTTPDPTTIAPSPPPFGIDAFDSKVSADAAGAPATQAGGHPYSAITSIDYNTYTNSQPYKGDAWPVEPAKDTAVDLPPGFLGNPSSLPQCTIDELAHSEGTSTLPLCEPESQVGVAKIRNLVGVGNFQGVLTVLGPLAIYNMVPPPGVPARFAFDVGGVIVSLDAHLRSSGDYGLSVESDNVPEGLAVAGFDITFWGSPADPVHEGERSCPGADAPSTHLGAPFCASSAPNAPILRQPTACTAPGTGLASTARADSWFDPGDFDRSTSISHMPPGFPAPPSEWGPAVGIDGCAAVPFAPGLSADLTTDRADSPSGLNVDITVPQQCWSHPEEICSSDLKDAEVKLPAGMTLNPSAAGGLDACTPGQVGLTTPTGQASPIHFDEAPVSCPDASKIGSVQITTPLLEEDLTGAVYLAKQGDNPFNSLLAMYLVAAAPHRGVLVKQAGEIVSDPISGRLTTIFKGAPQTPFSKLHVGLFGGPRAALKTPPTCGTYGISAKLTPWANPDQPATVGSAFEINGCPNSGFDPGFSAGTKNPLAGAYSPFSLRITREDGTQEIAGLSAHLPKGLIGKPAGIPYCTDSTLASISGALGTGAAQIASPFCPSASQVGTVTVGAGAGPTPFYTTLGRAYWAGPYKGAPLSIAVVAPAVAGPFDLGSVVVRNAVRIDPETAEVTAVSDPIPSILHGIPLDLRDIRLDLDRPDYILNPTSCEPMAIGANLTSVQGADATASNHFQVAGCDKLGFRPKLTLRLKGKTNRGAHPALRAVLSMPASHQANIARAQVTLPHAEFLDQDHIQNVCTQVQFGGAGCPANSVLGHATAWSPLLDQPLSGPVYLMSGFGHKLPDLAADLNGQLRVLLHGKIDTGPGGGIRNTFEVVPDAPVTKFVLNLKGGHRGLLRNSENVCAHPGHATALFEGHNGKIHDFNPSIRTDCGGKARRRR